MSSMFGRACKLWVFLVFHCRPVMCQITGPTKLNHLVGEEASFKWSTNDKSTILSATWGIKKANIPDPQYINVDILSSRVYINSDLNPDLIKRLSFDGNLKEGRAWFTLKNVTVDDTNEYIASISDGKSRVLPYTVVLNVTTPKEENGQSGVDFDKQNKKQINPTRSSRLDKSTMTKGTEGIQPKDPRDTVGLNVGTVVLISMPAVIAVSTIAIIAFLI